MGIRSDMGGQDRTARQSHSWRFPSVFEETGRLHSHMHMDGVGFEGL